jgi:hypothetical protein
MITFIAFTVNFTEVTVASVEVSETAIALIRLLTLVGVPLASIEVKGTPRELIFTQKCELWNLKLW